jgi:hypothetical protein
MAVWLAERVELFYSRLVGQTGKNFNVPSLISTESGVVISAGMFVVIFIFVGVFAVAPVAIRISSSRSRYASPACAPSV